MSTPPNSKADTVSTPARVTAAGQKSIMKALPPRAGLKMFWPRPPTRPFTTMMAKASPTIIAQYGELTGTEKASSTPVTTAERLPTVLLRRMTRQSSSSKITQAAADTAVSTSALSPKRITAAMSAGTSAISTSSIILRVFSSPRIWGAEETVRFMLTFLPSAGAWQARRSQSAGACPGRRTSSSRTPCSR